MRRPAVLGLLCAAVLAGCGDSSADNAYVEDVNRAQTDFAQTFEKLRDQITATSTPEQDRRTLRSFSSAVDDAVGDLRAIEPPADVADLHRRLVTQIGSYGMALEQARSAFGSADARKVLAAQAQLVARIERISGSINATINRINDELRG